MSRDHGDHADAAMWRLLEASREADTLKRTNFLRAAQVHSSLALRDAVLELTGMVRAVARAEWRARHSEPGDESVPGREAS